MSRLFYGSKVPFLTISLIGLILVISAVALVSKDDPSRKKNPITVEGGGDSLVPNPRLLIYCDSMLQPIVEPIFDEFERQEGVLIDAIFADSPFLVKMIDHYAMPDAFISGTKRFMDRAGKRFFRDIRTLSLNSMVIAVAQGNPHQVKDLGNLVRSKLHLGIGKLEKYDFDAAMKTKIKDTDNYEKLQTRLFVENANDNSLINQVRSGELDAVLIYENRCISEPNTLEEGLELIPLEKRRIGAAQLWGIRQGTKHYSLLYRLCNELESAFNRKYLDAFGFIWPGPQALGG